MAPIHANAGGPMEWCEIKYNGLLLMYTVGYWGTQPLDGYPLFITLHGGGSGELDSNDREWFAMATEFYLTSMKRLAGVNNEKDGAVHVALRGVTSLIEGNTMKDEYNIHWQPEGYVLVQELIKNLLQPSPAEIKTGHKNLSGKLNPDAKYFVNSNKIHLVGFSAGGDGAFNLVRGLPDVFASAVPAAGYARMDDPHTGDKPIIEFFQNFVNTPLWMQVGEKDDHWWVKLDEHQRSTRAKYYYMYQVVLDKLRAGSQAYEHYLSVVKDGTHNSWLDEDPDIEFEALIHLEKWYNHPDQEGSRASQRMRMDPIPWSNSKTRPWDPVYVIWNLSNRLPKPMLLPGTRWEQKRFNYWVFDRKPTITATSPENYTISLQKKTENGKTTIIIDEPTEWLGILLHTPSTNAEQPVRVEQRKERTWSRELTVSTNKNLMDEVWQARGDPNQLYTAMIYFEKDSGQVWQVKVAHSLYDGGAEEVLSTLILAT